MLRLKIEQKLNKQFITGRNADWGGAKILPIKGTEFEGLFLIDLNSLTGDKKIVLMVRLFNSQTEEYEDTDILEFDEEEDDLDLFLEKIQWVC